MPKRANPFLDDFMPQYKVHVGLKEIYKAGNKMKDVYARTRDLLYKGANRTPIKPLEDNFTQQNNDTERLKPNLKQITLDNNGKLRFNYAPFSNTIPLKLSCGACDSAKISITPCGYCDMPLCQTCLNICANCVVAFCTKCSIMSNSDSAARVCLSCYN